MRFLLYDHSGCLNRGCEAIVRTTVGILRKAFPNCECSLLSYHPEEDMILSDIPGLTVRGMKAQRLGHIQTYINAFYYKILQRSDYYYRASYAEAIDFAREHDICLIIGGDTFCYGDNELCRSITAEFKKLGKKIVLWGCSVGEEDLSEDKIATLRSLDAVFAREPLTKQVLEEKGLTNVRLFADPAFTLETKKPENKPSGKLLGLNFSPLVAKQCPGLEYSVLDFLERIEKETDYTPVLIPHVMIDTDSNNDYTYMKEIMDRANLTRTVILPDNLSATEYKGYISECEMLIAARTHATIAAYSTLVPVYALSYSVKARGIAKDLFGKELCVKSITEIDSADILFECFRELEANCEEMLNTLTKIIPAKKELSFAAGEALKEYV